MFPHLKSAFQHLELKFSQSKQALTLPSRFRPTERSPRLFFLLELEPWYPRLCIHFHWSVGHTLGWNKKGNSKCIIASKDFIQQSWSLWWVNNFDGHLIIKSFHRKSLNFHFQIKSHSTMPFLHRKSLNLLNYFFH